MKLNDKVSKKYGSHWGRSLIGGMGNLLVFFLVGLWHGKELHYVMWGLFNGIIIALSDLMSPLFASWKRTLRIKDGSRLFMLFQILRTFMIIVFAGYFDAVSDVSNGFICFKNTFANFRAADFKPCLQYLYDCGIITDLGIINALAAILIVLVISILRENKIEFTEFISKRFILFRWAAYYLLIIVMLMGFATSGFTGGFMYAAF